LLCLFFALFAGLEKESVFGELTSRNAAVSITQKDAYFNVTGLDTFHVNGMRVGNNSLIVLNAGFYKIDSQFSFSDGANTEFHIALGVNGLREDHCHAQRKIGTGGDVGSASFTCIDKFSKYDVLTIMMENVNNTNDPTIQSINLNVVLI